MLLEKNMSNFLDDLASDKPAPGGGSVAAYGGAMAAALVSMVCRVGLRKDKGENVKVLENTLTESEKLRKSLEELTEQDAQAFDDVAGAMKMNKATEAATALRKEALQRALQKATYVPLRTMEQSAEVLELALVLSKNSSKAIASDVAVAAIFAEGAIESALYNVEINLESIDDEEFVTRIEARTDEISEKIDGIVDEILESVEEKIFS